MTSPGYTSVLLVEDSPSMAMVYTNYLNDKPFTVSHVDSGQGALDFLRSELPQIVLLDLNLPDMNGMEVLKYVEAQQLPVAVVIITAHGSAEIAVDSMRHGAFDFLTKPFDAGRLLVTLHNAGKTLQLNRLVDTYKVNFGRDRFHGFIGSSLAMLAVYRMIDSAAPSKATVFITGESGTGKELCAEAIHKQSPRAGKPFIALNCAAIPKDLMESEIFGHLKGAFTGASSERKGAAAMANGGTMFLDEICEMDVDLQSKLLRFIQTGTYQMVGSSKLDTVDVRFVCATNRDPWTEVKKGNFREDLYYRLHVIPIVLPPLRDREDDVVAIAREFLANYSKEEGKGFARFAAETEDILRRYHWPGNIRQLQNVVRNIAVLNQGDVVTPEMLPPPLNSEILPVAARSAMQFDTSNAAHPAPRNGGIRPLWAVEKDAIDHAIAICDGNIPKAAALLEISASTIYRKRQAWKEEGKI